MGEENKKEVKKSKKKLIITIVVIVVIVLVLAGGLVYYHVTQTAKLIAEVNKISQVELIDANGNMLEEPIDMEIKTKGSYAIVEETLKNYINEVFTETQDLAEIFNEEKVMELTSFDTIKEDGPDFVNTKEEIANLRKAANDYVEKMDDFSSEEYIFSKIEDKDIGNYYKELYKNLATDEMTNESMKNSMEELETAKEEVESVLDELESIYNFLSENKDKWEIQGDQIVFTTESAYEEYESLMNSLEIL